MNVDTGTKNRAGWLTALIIISAIVVVAFIGYLVMTAAGILT